VKAREEVERLISFTGSAKAAFDVIERQMGVLVIRTQVLLSLCGIVITVTGFSGRAIAGTGPLARILVVAGLFTVLAGATVAVGGVFRVTWLTERLQDDERAFLEDAIGLRDRKARFLQASLTLFILGFALYVGAVSLLLINTPDAT
jgi:hypothetical protein